MPNWVKDDKKWKKAVDAFKKSKGKNPKTSNDYAIVTDIYKKMGGKIENEAFEAAESFIDFSDATDDKTLLRLAIVAEQDATSLYEEMAKKTDNEKVKRVFLDVAKEEKVHAGEFTKLLKEVDGEYAVSLNKGEVEVDDINNDYYNKLKNMSEE